jgi:hypothetical protein
LEVKFVSIFMMLRSPRRASAGILAVAGLITMLGTWSAPSLAAGPFRPFLGSWQGAGAITTQDGRREPISCRATYEGADGDQSLTQSLVCASDSFRLNIECSATAEGGQLQGQWQETTRGVQGSLTGQIGGGDFEGMVSGPGFTAQISIRAGGRRQVVHIAPSAGDIRSVDISLAKRR